MGHLCVCLGWCCRWEAGVLPCSLGTWQLVMAPGRVAVLQGMGLGVGPGTLVPRTFLCMEVVCAPLAPPLRGLLSQAVSD